jgi:glycosyltransferase involved in cell wall biosynthesis
MAEELASMGYNTSFFSGILPEDLPDSVSEKLSLLMRRLSSRITELRAIASHDVVYVNKGAHPYNFPPVFLYILRYISRCTVIYDICDPVWEHHPNRVDRTLSLADGVITSGNTLRDYASKHTNKVFVVPMSVETDKFRPIDVEDQKQPVIGWVGNGPDYREYLALLLEPLEQLASEFDFKFFLTSARNDDKVHALFDGSPFKTDIRDWVPQEDLVTEMNRIDIGVVPLSKTGWSEGKSPIKILEFGACGIPVVVSAVGDARQMVENGEDGFLIEEKREWYERLPQLLSDQNLRNKMAKKSRKKVIDRFSYQTNARRLAKIIESLHAEDEIIKEHKNKPKDGDRYYSDKNKH